ncbi:hypothetical protein [Algoriphagus aquimarinus]|uniref:hypothetical protein n=1 Tax=Algoriphagus aquimarinus TaxID=237018 RepID=UPI0030D9DE86|tara:strand:- start:21280 stop:21450 length:171 start_codon:yes stop_codon:yes gene_type:complete
MKFESDKNRRIPKDKEDIKVTPFGTKKEKRDVPDQAPREEFIEPKPNKTQGNKKDS